jgi:hypothetical protein
MSVTASFDRRRLNAWRTRADRWRTAQCHEEFCVLIAPMLRELALTWATFLLPD